MSGQIRELEPCNTAASNLCGLSTNDKEGAKAAYKGHQVHP